MTPEVQAFTAGVLVALVHAAVALAILAAAAATYAALSPFHEFARLREGDTASSVAFAGVVLALAIPLAMSLASSPSLTEILLWGFSTSVVQLLVCRVVDALLAGLPRRMMNGDVAAAGVLSVVKLATALVLAAAVAG